MLGTITDQMSRNTSALLRQLSGVDTDSKAQFKKLSIDIKLANVSRHTCKRGGRVVLPFCLNCVSPCVA